MPRRFRILLLSLFLLIPVLPGVSHAVEPVPAEVSGVPVIVDAATFLFDVGGEVRLSGLSVPEMNDPRGSVARTVMDEIITGRMVTCEILEKKRDRDQRLVGLCRADGVDMGEALIRAGYGFVYRQNAGNRLSIYDAAERLARDTGVGFWEKPDAPILLWERVELLASVLLGAVIAAIAGWLTQHYQTKLDIHRRQQRVRYGIWSELTKIHSTLSKVRCAKPEIATSIMVAIADHCPRYKQMASEICLLPVEDILAIDSVYSLIVLLVSEAKTKGHKPRSTELIDSLIVRLKKLADDLHPDEIKDH